MKKTLVTSFTDEQYLSYGMDCLTSFTKHWPESVDMVVYIEGDLPVSGTRIKYLPYEDVFGIKEWFDAIKPFELMTGSLHGQYNIQFDARMVRKPLIQNHACKTIGGKVIWLDADVITFDKVPEDFIDKTLPDDKLCCYLGRDWAYTESGYLGFNTEHERCEEFLQTYLSIFTSGIIFAQPGWHDCYGFDFARKNFYPKKSPAWFHDLAAGLEGKVGHPFVNSMLGQYMDHRKGRRKKSRSTKDDLVAPRTEAYWQ